MGKAQPLGMKPLAGQAQGGPQLGIRAVGLVSGAGMAEGREVDTDLVGASGFQMHLDQRGPAKGFDDLVVG